jgi:hypothetical protein
MGGIELAQSAGAWGVSCLIDRELAQCAGAGVIAPRLLLLLDAGHRHTLTSKSFISMFILKYLTSYSS